MAARVKERLRELKLSARAASLRVGDNPDLIRNLLRTPADSHPRTDTAAKAARALDWTIAQLMTGRDDIELLGDGSDVARLDRPVPPPASRVDMMELRGTAMGSIIREGVEGFNFEGTPLGYVRRPPSLSAVRDAYALLVTGDSMVPMHNPGETRIVNPRRPTAPGDTVIAITKHWEEDPGEAYIKILRRRTQNSVILEQLNPNLVLEIPTRYVAALHYVLTYDDLLGN